jgi:alpha-D-ribose 1-methylphosphonate 5-triphosphate synthase subunit PhnL
MCEIHHFLELCLDYLDAQRSWLVPDTVFLSTHILWSVHGVVLPILEFEEKIEETVEAKQMAAIIGETGFGKSTQLSQILHHRSYSSKGIIVVTQPRRVITVSVSRYI